MRQGFSNRSLPGAAGALALLIAAAVFFGGGDAPLSVATAVAADDCTALTQTPSRRRGHVGAQPLSIASRTPENVSATCNEAETLEGRFYRRSISVTWDVPSNFPQSLLSGYCTEKSDDSGEVLEWCDESSHAASQTRASISACFTDTGGDKDLPRRHILHPGQAGHELRCRSPLVERGHLFVLTRRERGTGTQ